MTDDTLRAALPFPTTDAMEWVRAFRETFPDVNVDDGTMLSWFANAIEHGRGSDGLAASATDEGPWKEDARRYAQNADYWRDLYETAAATIERLCARLAASATEERCGCTMDAAEPGPCPYCHHREHGSTGCLAASATDEPPKLPIYCTGGCDVCRDYAEQLGVPLIVGSPDYHRAASATDEGTDPKG